MPATYVSVEVLEVSGIPSSFTQNADDFGPFAVAWVGPAGAEPAASRMMGRTLLPRQGATLNLRQQRGWSYRTRVSESGALDIVLEIWRDRDFAPPEQLAQVRGTLGYAAEQPTSGERELSANGVTVLVRVEVRSEVAATALVPRSDSSGPHTILRLPSPPALQVAVTLTQILGLHQPASIVSDGPSEGETWSRSSSPRHGQFGREDGRVFLNRRPDDSWISGRRDQYIDLTARVRVVRGQLPAGAKLRWSIEVPTDPVIEHPQVRREAYRQLHSPFSDGFQSRELGHGPQWDGNLGRIRPADGQGIQDGWFAFTGYTLSNTTQTSAETLIVGGTSRVRLHCPNRRGDRFVLRVAFAGADAAQSIDDSTGMVTLWERLDVEYRPLTGSLPMTDVLSSSNEGFKPACVQLDYLQLNPMPMPHNAARAARMSRPRTPRPNDFREAEHLAYSSGTVSNAEELMCDDATLFPNRGKPGWFTLAGALAPYPKPIAPPMPAGETDNFTWQGHADIRQQGSDVQLLLDASAPERDPNTHDPIKKVRVRWPDRDGGQWLTFQASSPGRQPVAGRIDPPIVVVLGTHPLTQEFDASDSGLHNMLRHKHEFKLTDYFPSTSRVRVRTFTEAPYLAGESVLTPGDNDHVAGRLAIFTWHPVFRTPDNQPTARFASEITTTIVHEFTHSLGAPHICGHYTYRHDSGGGNAQQRYTCVMNYLWHAMRVDNMWVEGSVRQVISVLCGLHLSQMRRNTFQDNPVLRERHW